MIKNSCIIRQMQLADCAQVAAIDHACIANPWTVQDFEQAWHRSEQNYWVAVIENKIIGFAGVMTAADEADITHIAVLPEYQRQHVASSLLQEIIKQLQLMGVQTIYLEVRQHNSTAQSLYHFAKFEQVGTRKNYYTNPIEDAIIMKKEI